MNVASIVLAVSSCYE